jgi:hypothetical protein
MIPPDLSVCYGINTVTDRGEKLVGKKKHKSIIGETTHQN